MIWRLRFSAFLSIAICGLLPVLYVADAYVDDMAHARAERDVVTVSDALNSLLQRYQDATQAVETLAILDEPAATRTVRSETQAAIDTLRSFLSAESLFVMDERGTQIAGSGAVSVGQNYAFRPYFQQAIKGNRYVYPGIGKNLRTPRMFFSAPHFSARSPTPTGVVGLSVGMEKISSLLATTRPGTILGVMTEDGVVFASSSPEFLYKTVLPLSAARRAEIRDSRQFADEPLDAAEFVLGQPRIVVHETRYLVIRGRLNETNVEYFSLYPEDRAAYHVFMSAVGFVYLLIVYLGLRLSATLKQLQAQQRTLHETNASLLESQRALSHQATHDPLTNLLNRRGIMERLAKETARSARHGEKLAFGMCDIDHFKRINDSWGHRVGDEVLNGFARLLEENFRGYDLIARMGGEEFLVVMPCKAETDCDAIFGRFCTQVAQSSIATKSGAVSFTISVGVACMSPGNDDVDTLLDEADAALYQAKTQGRNRVVHAPGGQDSRVDAS